MKTVLAFVLFAFVFAVSGKHGNENPYENYIPNGQALVKFHFLNITDTANYLCLYNTRLPIAQKVYRFQIYSDSVIEIKVNSGQPTIFNVHSDSIFGSILSVPGDTTFVIIKRNSEISFKGRTSKISEYLSKVKVYLYNNFPKKEESPEDYNLRMDSQYVEALKVFEHHLQKEKLPENFVEIEKPDIWLHCEMLKQLQYNQRYWKYNQYIENKSLATNEIKNKELNLNFLTESAFDYLSGIRPARYDTLLMPQHINAEIVIQNTRDNIMALKGRLSDKLYSYFIASKLSSTIRFIFFSDFCKLSLGEKYKQIDKLMNEMQPLIKDSAMMKFIVEYKEKSIYEFNNQKKLHYGEIAPVFYLENINGEMVRLSDFKGKVILLNFWGTYCSPCINSIPKKNELAQKYGNNDFILINILLDYDFKRWKELIAEHKFEGIHLKCKGNWENMLKENYQIKGIPHYTLIDKSGKIILNDVPRDSLAFYVKENI